MKGRLCVLVCDDLIEDVSAVAQESGWAKEVMVASFPARCGRPPLTTAEIAELAPPGSGITEALLLGSACLSGMDAATDLPFPISKCPCGSCHELLAPATLVRRLASEGDYLVTPPWLKDWPARLAAQGFDQSLARQFFRESARRVHLLDTDPSGRHLERLQAVADYLGLPWARTPIGREHLAATLDRAVLDWRARRAQERLAEGVRQSRLRTTDYAMGMDFMARLGHCQAEAEVAEGILDLARLLFGATRAFYVAGSGGAGAASFAFPPEAAPSLEETARWARMEDAYARLPSGRGFALRIGPSGQPTAALVVQETPFADRLDHYVNVALSFVGVMAMAIDSARAREQVRLAQDRIEQANLRLDRVLQSLQGIVCVVDRPKGEIVFANEPARQALGAWAGKDCHACLVSLCGERCATLGAPTPAGAGGEGSEWETQGPDGVWRLVRSRPIRWIGGRDCSLLMALDITDRKRAEQERLRAQERALEADRLQALRRMAAAVAHNFNNAMTGVLGYLELAKDSGPRKDPEMISKAIHASRRAADLGGLMLLYLGQGKERTARFDLAAAVGRAIEDIRPAAPGSCAISTRLDPGLPPVLGDPAQMTLAVRHVLANAVEALLPGGGRVDVAAEEISSGAEQWPPDIDSRGPEDRLVMLSIADTGRGMDAGTLAKATEPFFSLKSQSRGMGLSVALGVVRGHGGALRMTSAPEQGTTVRIFLPAASAAAEDAGTGSP